MPRYPRVIQKHLYLAADTHPIAVGTSVWEAWLTEHTTFTYDDAPFSYTARREERPGGQYWYAYKRTNGKLHKRYLGRTNDLTLERMQEIAQILRGQREEQAVAQEVSSLIATRFAIPRIGAEYVTRPHLLERFSRAVERPCTIVTAPAGSGKTTLLALGCEQQHARGWHIAWLSLERSEQTPTRFWRYVLAAIEHAAPGRTGGALEQPSFSHLPTIESTLTPLINALDKGGNPLLLVLDDYHLAATSEIDADLLFLIQHMPRGLRLVISSRVEPALPLARLRVQRQVAEIRQDQLRFSGDEAAIFLERTMRLHLTQEQVATLEARTEGWVAGLQLAALSLTSQNDVATFLADFAGNNRYIDEYLMGEVIGRQPSEIQDFLLRTSILSRMCGSLCDAVTCRSDGQATLKRLEAANLFLVSLDQHGRWYRYHHLFAEMLRERLAQENPALLAECHERAAHWFAAHGDTREAIEHALVAQVYPLAARLIATEVEPMLQQGEIATALTWLNALPLSTLDAHPHLALTSVAVLLMSGEIERAIAVLQHIEIALLDSITDSVLRGELAAVQALKELVTGGDMSLAMRRAREAVEWLPPEHGVVRDLAALLHGATMPLLQDDLAGSLQIMTQTAQSSLRHGNYLIASFALENRTLKELSQGRLHQAERTCQEALRMAARPDGKELPFASWAHLRLGDIYRERNQIERARASLEYGLEQGTLLRHPEIVIDAYIALARVYDLRGERERVLDIMRENEQAVQTGRITPHTAWQIEAFRARVLCGWGNLAEAAHWAKRYAASTQHITQNLPLALTEFCEFTLARIEMAEGKYAAAQQLLKQLLESGRTSGRERAIIEASLLLALADQTTGHIAQALTRMTDALHLAAPEGFVRLFIDEGQPMIDLLARYLSAPVAASEQHASAASYARHLLEQAGQPAAAPTLVTHPDMPSVREREILRLLADGKSNDAIATELVLALSTVKWHLMHLYRKLGVNSRSQAIARGRALGLIA